MSLSPHTAPLHSALCLSAPGGRDGGQGRVVYGCVRWCVADVGLGFEMASGSLNATHTQVHCGCPNLCMCICTAVCAGINGIWTGLFRIRHLSMLIDVQASDSISINLRGSVHLIPG